jgi:hypothetical protein
MWQAITKTATGASFGLEGDGQHRLLIAGTAGAANPDHVDVDRQSEQGDPGGDRNPREKPVAIACR